MKYDKIPIKAGGEAMNTDTTIAKNIRVADEKASYDAACKRLLSEKIILAWVKTALLVITLRKKIWWVV